MEDKRQIGERNALAVLNSLQRFGWLTSRMISALVWPDKSQSIALTRRSLAKLIEQKLVLRRDIPSGGECYVLSASGARRLTDELGIKANSGNTLPLGNAMHRAAANWYVIQKMRDGYKAWTEHEIQQGNAPVGSFAGKTPDALLESDFGLTWVEVENSWKNRHERERIVQLCANNLGGLDTMTELSPNNYLFRVAIVSTNIDALRALVRSFQDAYRRGFVREAELAEIEVALLPVSASLIPDDLREIFLWFDILKPMLERDIGELRAGA